MQEQVRQQLLGELPSHRARVYSVCRQRLRWHPDAYELAHDMTQEVMLKASRKIDSFRGGARLSTWLMQIAINQTIDFSRTSVGRNALRTISVDDLVVETNHFSRTTYAFNPFVTNHTEEIYINRIAIKRLFQALDTESKCLVLMLMQGRAYSEMSVRLRIPEGTVKSKINRLRGQLRASFVGKQRYH
ncbi:MAG TPA: sigma-70 family RNA polymerase sigma factor [Patescibacteria group bacterium]